MQDDPSNPLMTPFMVTADEAATARPSVDPEMIREIFVEAATRLHNGLALDGLNDHDVAYVINELCIALVAEDPGEELRTCARSSSVDSSELADPSAVSASFLVAAEILRV